MKFIIIISGPDWSLKSKKLSRPPSPIFHRQLFRVILQFHDLLGWKSSGKVRINNKIRNFHMTFKINFDLRIDFLDVLHF